MSAVNRPAAFVPRYNATERTTHWIVAICFVLATLSGLAFFHPAFWFLSAFVGGGVWSRILHPWVGTLMVLAFVPMAAWYWKDNILRDYDFRWMSRLGDQLSNAQDMPEIDKYNAGQKMLFWSLVVSLLGLLASGVVMWLHPDPRVSIGLVRLSGVVHVLCAFVLFMGIMVHVYSAVFWIKGSMRAMLRGEVKAGWAKHHHALWYRRVMGQQAARPAVQPAPKA